MPPSSNHLYAGTVRRYPSAGFKAWKRDFDKWSMANSKAVLEARNAICALRPSQALHVSRTYWFNYSSVMTQSHRPKRNDTSNRIKALDDAIAQLLGIDDCRFWDGSYYKRIHMVEKHEYANVTLEPIAIPSPTIDLQTNA